MKPEADFGKYHQASFWEVTSEEIARRVEVEKAADQLEASGVLFQKVPAEIYPGMRFISPNDLIEQGFTKYSRQQIAKLIRTGEIPAYSINGRILDPKGVEKLLERERSRLAAPSLQGRKPGARNRKPRSSHTKF